CERCFQALLEPGPIVNSPPKECAREPVTDKTAEGKRTPVRSGSNACLACNVPLSRESESVGFSLFGALFPACLQEMNAELDAAQQTKEVSSPTETSGGRGPSDVDVWTPGAETVICAGCERPMPGPGSYRMLQ